MSLAILAIAAGHRSEGAPSAAPAVPFVKPGSAGAGYVSPKLRTPLWAPTFAMAASSIVMPCNYSGFYDLNDLEGFGFMQFDWSNKKDRWCNDQPMTASEAIATQSEMVHARFPEAKIGVYRNGVKALNWFSEIRAKMDDPAYSGWFMPFKQYPGGGSNTNHSYFVPDCTYEKCSGLWHDQTQTPEHPKKHALGRHHSTWGGAAGGWRNRRRLEAAAAAPKYDNGVCTEECDCGKLPCGEYVYDHRNTSFSAWFVSSDGPIINNRTLLAPGVVSFYLDDSAWVKGFKQGGGTGGITEADAHFMNDTGLSFLEMQAFHAAYARNMETLYDNIVAQGGWVWQLFQDGPGLSQLDPRGKPYNTPAQCIAKLRTQWCRPNGTAAQSATFHGLTEAKVNDTAAGVAYAEQVVADFLLTRGNWSWLGYDWNGCYPRQVARMARPPQMMEDFGVPLNEHCRETGDNTGIFVRNWSKAAIVWDCNAIGASGGKITRLPTSTPTPVLSP